MNLSQALQMIDQRRFDSEDSPGEWWSGYTHGLFRVKLIELVKEHGMSPDEALKFLGDILSAVSEEYGE